MVKASRFQLMQIERDAHQLRRAISIMTTTGSKAITHNGIPVPGLSVTDWQNRLDHLENCLKTRTLPNDYQNPDDEPAGEPDEPSDDD